MSHAFKTPDAQPSQEGEGDRQAMTPPSPDVWEIAIEGSGTGVWDRNIVTGDIWYSASWHAILGYTPGELSNQIETAYLRVHPEDLAYVQATMQAHFEARTAFYEVEHRLRCKDGSFKWVLSRGRVISRDAAGRALRMVGTTTDITARKQVEMELQVLADLDDLTQLPNRRHFRSRMSALLAELRQGRLAQASVMMIDIDRFKAINDSAGHAAGDAVIRHFADLLRKNLRADDVIGRLGGDEFAVLLPEMDEPAAVMLAARLKQAVSTSPASLAQIVLPYQVSIGIAGIDPGARSCDAALAPADTALYQAKARRR
ncbi:GGDEF domain-containing protein [Acidocella facilis]|uniref:GGDEF domain-containing protein n=1 Tax=Acidocella facilis TaxID=525 RepID=UPI001F35096D|nr:sensor domain-containing diguanylate cyclase [Acidocella facilis]